MNQTAFSTKAQRANDIRDLIVIFDGELKKPHDTTFGVEKKFRVSIDKTRREANRKAIAELEKITDPLLVTEEQKQILRGYTGEGNIGGSTDEYYTPTWLANGMWDMLEAYGGAKGNILEPSAGTGVFNGTKPDGVIMTATELSPISSKINQILHPEDLVKNTNFEKLAADETTNNTYDSIVGNVPFGDARGAFSKDDPTYAHRKTKQTYFVDRAIDKVKPGGYITLVVPQDIIGAKSLEKFRAQISLKAEFLGAHKIAAGAFSNQGSDSVVTDVLIMRKHSAEMADLILNAKSQTLRDAKVLWAQFIKGQWFDKDGKKFVNGEIIKGAANYDRDLVSIPGLPKAEKGKQLTAAQTQDKSDMIDSHNQATAKSLSKKFESRIDWDLLELTEPDNISYIEGDQRMINGRWHEYVDGEWLLVKISNAQGLLDTDKFGASSISELSELVSSPAAALALDFKHLKNINDNFRDKTEGVIANAFTLARKYPAAHQERIVKGVLIGAMIENYNELKDRDEASAKTMLREIQAQLNGLFDKLGTSHNINGLKRVKGDHTAGYYQSFVNAMDKDGNFSDLISGKLDTSGTVAFDDTDPQGTVDMLSHFVNHSPVPLEAFVEAFKGTLPGHVDINDENSLLDYLSEFENIAIDHNGNLQQFERATSGSIPKRKAGLMKGLANDHFTDKQKLNMTRQLDAIERKRTITSKENIVFDMRGKWIPRQLVVEFFHDMGYDELDYVDIEVGEDGSITEIPEFEGTTGLFTGYYTKDGKKVNRKDENFIRQVEKYLNGQSVSGGNGIDTSKYREQIRAMERQFQNWIKLQPGIDSVVDSFNDTFNSKIAFEHSSDDLNLQNVSGNILNMGYQNSAIRRLSEEGRGILGFGTGLGKTFTALGLAAYNTQEGRSKRTCIVVPKSVTENWIAETIDFYGKGNLKNIMFVGFNLEYNDDGELKTEPVLVNGEPQFYPASGNPKTTPVMAESSPDEITKRMHKIPHSNTTLVIMSKEQFAKIPMKAGTVKENADQHMDNLSATGKVDIFANTYKKQQAKEAALAKLVKEGSAKEYDYPYFEDMHFDTVITDEAHNYRNSQEAGSLSRSLSYLSAGTEAKVAADMRQKMQYLGRKQKGRGAILLTATPTPNSPLDIYNMLSHIVTPEEWIKLGIANQDDFINVFGETSEVQINRIDGTLAMAQGLTGFKNLDGLRALFNSYCNRKDINDVATETRVPEIINNNIPIDMSDEQKEVYDMLRLRAEVLRAKSSEGGIEELLNMSGKSPAEQQLILEIEATYPDDQIFSVMRDMERVSTDVDLFNKRMTFVFAKDKAEQAKKVVAGIKTPIKIKIKQLDENGEEKTETIAVDLEPVTKDDDDGKYIVTINDKFESALVAGLKKEKLTQSDITHPVPAKYARLLEFLKSSHEAGGKQIIFTEEKSQHKKLHRMICHHLNLKPNEVGILNGSTVSGDESAINESNHKKLGAKAAKKLREELEAQGLDSEDLEQSGLETIAKRYNSGQFRVLICNKKAEVGVNLHIGTTDIHHMSLPWTPASVDQRNGRGARVGAPQSHVNSHFYLAKGSFDQFRLETITRKRNWQTDLIKGSASRAENGDADDQNDIGLLLANNPEEYAAMLEMRKKELEEKVFKSKVETAEFTLNSYLKAVTLSATDVGHLESNETAHARNLNYEQNRLDKAERELQEAEENLTKKIENPDGSPNALSWHEWRVAACKKTVVNVKKAHRKDAAALKQVRNRLKAIEKAKKQVKQFKPQVKEAIDSGVLAHIEPGLVDNPDEYLYDAPRKRTIKAGATYLYTSPYGYVPVRVRSCNNEEQTVRISGIGENVGYSSHPAKKLLEEIIISESEEEILDQLSNDYYDVNKVYSLLDNDTFFDYLNRSLLPTSTRVVTNEDNEDNDYELIALGDVVNKGTIVYPDKTNSALKQSVAKHYIKNHQQNKSQHKIDPLCAYLFGQQYTDVIADMNPDAETDEDIAQFVVSMESLFQIGYEAAMNRAIERDDLTFGHSELTSRGRAIRRQVPADAFRVSGYQSAIDARQDELKTLLSTEFNNQRKRISDEIRQKFAAAEKSTTDEIRARLATIPDRTFNYYLGSIYDLPQFLEHHLTNTAYADNLPALIMDLIHAGYDDERESDDSEMTQTIVNRLYVSIHSETRTRPSILTRFMATENSDEDSAEKANVTATEKPDVPASANTSDLPFADILKQKFNIVCMRNGTDVEFRSFRNKVFATGEPYEYIAFYDPAGRGGPLNQAMSPLKRRKKSLHASDASFEFEGVWWFVKADMSDQEILDAFGL